MIRSRWRIRLACALLALGAGVAPAAPPLDEPAGDDWAETFGASDDAPINPAKPASAVPPGLFDAAPTDLPVVGLGPIDLPSILREDDDRAAQDKALRYGIGRVLNVDAAQGLWFGLPDGGRAWGVDVACDGAFGLRLHFADLQIPPGARLIAYSPADTAAVAGPLTGRGWNRSGDAWTQTLFGGAVRVEYIDPSAKPGDAPRLPFRIDRVQHVYRHPLWPMDGAAGAGGCLDATCYAAWGDVARGVAGIGVIDRDSLFCTGQLINNLAGDLTPYWLTARHCVDTPAEAQSAEIYWLFQTGACNGEAPALPTRPQSAACTLLAGGAVSDYALLMVEGTIPRTAVYWVGWTSILPPAGTACAALHHPQGSWKRYSFGTRAAELRCASSGHLNIDWDDASGGTEPGSSGGGAFRSDTRQLIGQLHCGPSSCSNPSSDDFGAFATTYPAISSWLAGGTDDALEPNDACAGARVLGVGTYDDLVLKSVDDDWYRISVAPHARVTALAEFTHGYGDIDMQLFASCGGAPADTSAGTDDFERVTYQNGATATDVFVRLFLYSDTRNAYTLTILPPVANDDCPDALPLTPGSTQFGNLINAAGDGAAGCGGNGGNRDVWYRFDATCDGTLSLRTCGTNDAGGVDQGMDTVLSVHAGCPGTAANQIACNDDTTLCTASDTGARRDSAVDVAVLAGQSLRVRVSHFGSNFADGEYRLSSSFAGAALPPPSGVAASTDSCDAVTLAWSGVGGANEYAIFRGTSSNPAGAAQIGTTAALEFDDASATPGLALFYFVRAHSACQTSPFSEAAAGSRAAPPAPPTDVAAADGESCAQIDVAWAPAAGATGYEVWRADSPDLPGALIATVASAEFADLVALPGAAHYYRVRAIDECGAGELSAADAGSLAPAPQPPAELYASDGQRCDRVDVSWSVVAGATEYSIWRGRTADPSAAQRIGSTGASPFHDYGAAAGESFRYWVRSVGACGEGPFGGYDAGSRCEARPGDVNCDGATDNGDIDAFVLALLDPISFVARYPSCSISLADVNRDGSVDNGDIEAFVEALLR